MESEKNPHLSEQAGAPVSVALDTGSSTISQSSNATITDHAIVISRGLGNLHIVAIQPPHPAHEPQLFDDYRKARGFAGGLRLCNRWQIVDETGGGK